VILDVLYSRVFRFIALGVIVIAGVAIGFTVASSSNSYALSAVFARAPGLFSGASVQILGVNVGTVTKVVNVGDVVDVSMQVSDSHSIPREVVASLVSPQLLGEPNIELNPGYTGGPRLARNATIPLSHTSVPESTDQVLKDLQRTLSALNPKAVGDLVTNLAEDLQGQGQGLNELLHGAAGTLSLLAAKGDDLGQLNATLGQLTGTLDARTSQITQLITDYDTVSGVISQHSSQLNDAIIQLSGATSQLVNILSPNLVPLEADIGTLTTAGRTLDRNLGSIGTVLSGAMLLFTAAQRAYDPNYNWINLNLQLPAGTTGAYEAGLIRDRLAGICRRIAANHASGLSATELATLTQCGNPASNFFNPLLNTIPAVLNALPGGNGAPGVPVAVGEASPAQLLQKGLQEIPGITGATGPTNAPTTPSTGAKTPSSTTTTTTPSTCGILSVLLHCSSGTSGSSGLDGLLSDTQASPPATPAPSLQLAAESLLPPMPGQADHDHQRDKTSLLGHIAHWVSDTWSWM
jgi:phospholipid/cholesterol/gamma-HCH transport system substrate-binding protein